MFYYNFFEKKIDLAMFTYGYADKVRGTRIIKPPMRDLLFGARSTLHDSRDRCKMSRSNTKVKSKCTSACSHKDLVRVQIKALP